MSESELGLAWIESTLSGDTTLQGLVPGGVHQTFVLPGTTPPYVLVKYVPGNDVLQFGGIAYSDLHYQVTVDGPIASQTAIAAAADRINNLLTIIAPTSVSGGTIISSVRSQPISDDLWVDAAKWHTSGGDYHIRAKSS